MKHANMEITENSLVTEVVLHDYRTAEIFTDFGIDFCCGGRQPLHVACDIRGLDAAKVLLQLQNAVKTVPLPNDLPFTEWSLSFLIDFIVNVHHAYIRKAAPLAIIYVKRFADGHEKKYPHLTELKDVMARLSAGILPHLHREEEIFFPYIKQITHAQLHNEPYAGLLVRTLRKPLQDVMQQEHIQLFAILQQMRMLTDNYTIPAGACVTHKVTYSKLKELDNDLVQHLHLENDILLPKAISIEKELLSKSAN